MNKRMPQFINRSGSVLVALLVLGVVLAVGVAVYYLRPNSQPPSLSQSSGFAQTSTSPAITAPSPALIPIEATTTTFAHPGATSTNPNQVTWAQAELVVKDCKVVNLQPDDGYYSYLVFKNGDIRAIVDYHPTIAELTALARSVSSTCGVVQVRRPVY